MALPSNPITRKENYLSNIAGQTATLPSEPHTREEEYLDYIARNGGGGGTGEGDMTKAVYDDDLAVASAGGIKAYTASAISDKVDKVQGKGLSSNDYDDSAKAIVDGVTTALDGKVSKSQTAGLLKNDGTVDTNTYAQTSALSDYIAKSQTSGLVKNDGTIDTTTTGAVSANTSAITAIKDGTDIDSFGDVETALDDKVDKVSGKGLSKNDYTDADKAIVGGVNDKFAGSVTLLDDTVGWVGKNLYNCIASTSTDEFGLTWTVDAIDKNIITVSGTPTGFKAFPTYSNNVLPAGRYILSGIKEDTTNVALNYLGLRNGTTIVQELPKTLVGNDYYFDIPDNVVYDNLYITLKRNDNNVACSGTIRLMVRKSIITDATYEPYHESVESALDGKQDAFTVGGSTLAFLKMDDELFLIVVADKKPTKNSDALLESGTIYDAIDDVYKTNGVLGAKNINATNYISKTSASVVWTANSDGSITAVSGTATGNNGEIGNQLSDSFVAPFTAQVKILGGLTGQIYLYPYDHTDSARPYKDATQTTRLTTTDNQWGDAPLEFYMIKGHRYTIAGRVIQNSSANNDTMYPRLLLATDTDPTYVFYAMTNRELTEKVQGIINAATNAADFAAFKTAIGNL